jgi:hypothetical protein
MGVAIGSTLYAALGGLDETLEWLQSVFAKANMVFTPQLNFVLTVTDVHIPAVSGDAEPWDACSLGISEQLSQFRQWDQSQRSRQGLWHLFDDCYSMWVGRSIGLATVGNQHSGLCAMQQSCACYTEDCDSSSCVDSYSNTGLSWFSSSTWETFAHEIGHNFGADHSFEDGQGTTGGIMDYGDGTYNGIYQFNTQYRKDEMCAVISNRVDQGCEAITTYATTCGDGVVDGSEECECSSGTSCAFCEECLLEKGKQCTPEGDPCCTSSGMFEPSSTQCAMPGGAGTGYCQQGTCTGTWCTDGLGGDVVGDFCGLHADNDCKMRCSYQGACDDLPLLTWQSTGVPVNYLDDGSLCSGGAGTCVSGHCELAPTPAPSPAPPEARTTASGCVCRQSWSYRGSNCSSYCCNPDGDTRGEWCFTDGDCGGTSWGHCDADPRGPATSPTPAPMHTGASTVTPGADAAWSTADPSGAGDEEAAGGPGSTSVASTSESPAAPLATDWAPRAARRGVTTALALLAGAAAACPG